MGEVNEAAVGPKLLKMAGFCSEQSLLTGQLFLLLSGSVVGVAGLILLCSASEMWNQLCGFSIRKALSEGSA